MHRLGIDVGSIYVSAALLREQQVIASIRREHWGDIRGTVERLLAELPRQSCDRVGVTGSVLASAPGVIDNTLAVIEGTRLLLPGCRNAFFVGGQSFSLILFDEAGRYSEHSVNPPCASGTGLFIDQQAGRLGLEVAELARRAEVYSGRVPTIATRCAVFAKSDMIHSMQEGYSLDSVCAGLCEGVARNVIETLVKGRALHPPVGMVGGVSHNSKIVHALAQALGVTVQVPDHSAAVGAVGAALMASASTLDPARLSPALERERTVRAPLTSLARYPAQDARVLLEADGTEVLLPEPAPATTDGVYLGIDVGSTSTKALLLTAAGEVAGGFYAATRGDPLGAVRRLGQSITRRFPAAAQSLRGAATTGSGRKMVRQLFQADLDLDEITAHAKAAVWLEPEVDTIIEIGGQDSKFTRIRGGEVYYSAMNYACAAGTGSFIEEQAKRLQLDLQGFAAAALDQRAPYTSDRCTVYMERDVALLLGEGWSKGALAAAVLFSVRDNYLAKVVGKSSIGQHVVFQGATARNRALVAAFEAHLGQPIHVSPYCHLTGALGAALHCREQGLSRSSFSLALSEVALREESCSLCSNRCTLTLAHTEGGTAAAWGMKCGRELSDSRRAPQRPTAPELRYREAVKPLLARPGDGRRSQVRVGLPQALYHVHYYPLWRLFLTQLGFTVVSEAPSRRALERGKAIVNSDFCAPMILAHGAVEGLLRRRVDRLFLPAVVNEIDDRGPIEPLLRKKERDTYNCFVSQYLPSIVAGLTSLDLGGRLISPLLRMGEQTPDQMGEVIAEAMSSLVDDREEVRAAFVAAWQELQRARAAWCRPADALPEKDRVQVVLLGRPYTLLNPTANLGIPHRLESLEAEILFQDEIDLTGFDAGEAQHVVDAMHWHHGKQIIRVAEWTARSRSFFPVLLGSFRCGQDSFLVSYIREIMARHDKPFLVLEIDEHASDVGYTTRIEAALRTFETRLRRPARRALPASPPRTAARRPEADDTVLIPNIGTLVGRFWAEAIRSAGFTATVLDTGTEALATGYKYAHGGECLPVVAIGGGAIRKLKEAALDPGKVLLYLPTVCTPCNFHQFPKLAEAMLAAAGFGAARVLAPNALTLDRCWPPMLGVRLLEAGVAACQIQKMYHRVVPYEATAGQTDRVFAEAAEEVARSIRAREVHRGLERATALFAGIERDERGGRKPRIGLLGDYYVKYNDVVNQQVCKLVHALGGELLFPSITDNTAHFYDTDVRVHGDTATHLKLLRRFEQRMESISAGIIGDQAEPEWGDCVAATERHGWSHYLPGETALNVGRALYYIERGLVDAILHVNPIFCGPGVVSASIFRKVQADLSVPIIDIFYDGTGDANRLLIPHLHYLRERLERGR